MLISKRSRINDYFTEKLQGLVWKLENIGDSNFEKNGELSFIQDIGRYFSEKPFVAFDIGANVGEYTDMILKYVQTDKIKLHLFEPQQTCFDTIVSKFTDNKNIHLNHFGLSDKSSDTLLYKDFDKSGLASVHKRNLSYYNMEMNETESITLRLASEYIEKNQIKKIHLLKIDVEGHELSALSGFGEFLNPENVSLIQFEYGGANLDSHTSLMDLFSFFESKGFVLCKMMRHSLEIQSYKPRFENFMYQNWVAVSPQFIK